MSHAVGTIGRICFMHFTGAPGVAEAHEVLTQVVEARRHVGAPLLIVAIVDSNVRPPGVQTSREILRMMTRLDHLSESHQVVVLGDGVIAALQRGFMMALSAVVPNPVTITDSVDEALAAVCSRLGLDVRRVTDEARSRGLIPLPLRAGDYQRA